ncbi:hypothetical protein ACJJTC_012170 [Scirpophaga incertulas]
MDVDVRGLNPILDVTGLGGDDSKKKGIYFDTMENCNGPWDATCVLPRLSAIEVASAVEFERQDREIKDLKIEITELRHKMEVQEQLNVKRELEIVGVPEQLNENLTHVVMIASKKIGVDLQMTDLDEVRRVGTKNPKNTTNRTVSRPIVVKFLSKIKRDDVLSAYKGRRKLTSEDLVPGSSSSVYINERLTAQNRQLFREARTRAKMQNFQYCWTRNGTVFIRKAANTNGFKHPAIPIRSQKDIEDHLGQVCTPAECVLQEDFPRESVPAILPN